MNKTRKQWVSFARAIAIVFVVTQHLVASAAVTFLREFVVFLTLCAVPIFMALMGYTKACSIKSYYKKPEHKSDYMLKYTLFGMGGVLAEYFLATLVYLRFTVLGYVDYSIMPAYLLSFNASGPMYFIGYYIIFGLWGPCIYALFLFVKKIFQRRCLVMRLVTGIILILFWLLGYFTTDWFDIFGSIYLFLYGLGMVMALMPPNQTEIKYVKFLVMPLFIIAGGYVTYKDSHQFFNGNPAFALGIDKLFPKLEFNPTPPSYVLFSLGMLILFWMFYHLLENMKIFQWLLNFISKIGDCSLDIFLWHLFIIGILRPKIYFVADDFALSTAILLAAGVFIPLIIRYFYKYIKKNIYSVICYE